MRCGAWQRLQGRLPRSAPSLRCNSTPCPAPPSAAAHSASSLRSGYGLCSILLAGLIVRVTAAGKWGGNAGWLSCLAASVLSHPVLVALGLYQGAGALVAMVLFLVLCMFVRRQPKGGESLAALAHRSNPASRTSGQETHCRFLSGAHGRTYHQARTGRAIRSAYRCWTKPRLTRPSRFECGGEDGRERARMEMRLVDGNISTGGAATR